MNRIYINTTKKINKVFFNKIKAILTGTIILASVFNTSLALAENNKPETVPALRQWTGTTGDFTLSSNSKIIVQTINKDNSSAALNLVSPTTQSLLAVATKLKQDIQNLTGFDLAVDLGDLAGSGDIFVQLNDLTVSNSELKQEGYTLNINSSIEITANTTTGIFYGGQSILQILNQDETDDGLYSVPQGFAIDYPSLAQRHIMIDLARHFMEPNKVEEYIKLMAWYKLNTFHMHFSDWNALRIDGAALTNGPSSNTYDGLGEVDLEKNNDASAVIGDHSYDAAEIASFVQLAEKHHVTIIPELDLPARSSEFNKWAELTTGQTNYAFNCASMLTDTAYYGARSYEGGGYWAMDYTNPIAKEWAKKVLLDFSSLFPNSDRIHFGVDEVSEGAKQTNCPELVAYANSKDITTGDVLAEFIEEMGEYLISIGKKPQIWSWFERSTSVTPLSASVISTNASSSGIPSSNVIDNNNTTRWAASDGTFPQWVEIDLGTTKAFDAINIGFNHQDTRTYNHNIQVSSDGNSYTEIVASAASTNSGDTLHNIIDGQARYIRVNISNVTDNWWASISEISLSNSGTSVLTEDSTAKSDLVVDVWESASYNTYLNSKPYDVVLTGIGEGLYYSPRNDLFPIATYLYDTWAPQDRTSTKILGYKIALWPQNYNDDKVDDTFILNGLTLPTASFAERTWNTAVTSDTYLEHSIRRSIIGSPYGSSSIARTNDGTPNHSYEFNENSGTTLMDENNNLNGTLVSSIGNNTFSGSPAWVSEGKNGSALEFDGSYHARINGIDIAPPWTVATWVKLDSNSENGTLLWSPQYSLDLHNGTGEKVAMVIQDKVASQEVTYRFNNLPLDMNSWVHVALVGGPDSTELFIDGVSAGTIPHAISLPLNRIGAGKNNGNGLKGAIDELKIYDEALSDKQIISAMNDSTPPSSITVSAVTASTSEAVNPASNINDGNSSTRWAASNGTLPQWVQYEFESESILNSIEIEYNNQTSRDYTYSIDVSEDGVIFTTLVSSTNSNSSGNSLHTNLNTNTRFMRINITSVSGSWWASVKEVTVQ